MQSAIATVHSGPARVLIGDPTTASGAGLVDLGHVPNVDIKLNLFRQMSANETDQIMKDGLFGNIKDADVSLSLLQTSASILAALIAEVSDETTSIGAETTLATLAASTIIVVPEDVYGSALTSLKTHYLPACIAMDVGNFVQQLAEGNADKNPYTVNFKATLAATDQAAQALNTKYRIWFRGSPVDAVNETTPTAWSLPSGY